MHVRAATPLTSETSPQLPSVVWHIHEGVRIDTWARPGWAVWTPCTLQGKVVMELSLWGVRAGMMGWAGQPSQVSVTAQAGK